MRRPSVLGTSAPLRIYLSIPLGINVRDILRLGTLEAILDIDRALEVVILSPARLVREFHREFASERVTIAGQRRYYPTRTVGRLVAFRRRLHRRGVHNRSLHRRLLDLESRLARPSRELAELFSGRPPALVVSVHPQDWWDWELVGYARRCGVPTLGILRSWDNIKVGMCVHVDYLGVWSEANEREARELEGYQADHVRVVGAPPLDPYFASDVIRPRRDFLESLELNPDRKLVVYAPAGRPNWGYGEETSTLDELLRIRASVPSLEGFQIVCRLHPHSRLEAYWSYRDVPGLALSFGSYAKALGWTMTRAEVEQMANLLHHADAVVCGWTTVVIEAALFDTPTVVGGFCTLLPEGVDRYMAGWTYNTYFSGLVNDDAVPFARSASDLEAMLVKAFRDPAWYRQRRQALADHFVPVRDGRTAQRIAGWVADLVNGGGA